MLNTKWSFRTRILHYLAQRRCALEVLREIEFEWRTRLVGLQVPLSFRWVGLFYAADTEYSTRPWATFIAFGFWTKKKIASAIGGRSAQRLWNTVKKLWVSSNGSYQEVDTCGGVCKNNNNVCLSSGYETSSPPGMSKKLLNNIKITGRN